MPFFPIRLINFKANLVIPLFILSACTTTPEDPVAVRNATTCPQLKAGISFQELTSSLGDPINRRVLKNGRTWMSFKTPGAFRAGDISALVDESGPKVISIYCDTGDNNLPTSTIEKPLKESEAAN